MSFVEKQEVANRLLQIIEEKFNGVVLQYSISAKMRQSTLQSYVEGRSLPGGENLARLAQAGGVTTDWILLGAKAVSFVREIYSPDEQEVIKEYRAASTKGRETGRMVFRLNAKDEKKVKHPLRRKTDVARKNAG